MSIDFYADQLFKLDDGRHAIVQFRTSVKEPSEPWSELIWTRTRSYLLNKLKFPAQPTHFQPLATREIVKRFRTTLDTNERRVYRLLFWMARSTPRKHFPLGNNVGFHERIAESINDQFSSLERDFPHGGTFDVEAAMLPKYEIVDRGASDGFLHRTYFTYFGTHDY